MPKIAVTNYNCKKARKKLRRAQKEDNSSLSQILKYTMPYTDISKQIRNISDRATFYVNFPGQICISRTFDQEEGPWPLAKPLPLPVWSSICKKTLKFESIYQFERIAQKIENVEQKLLAEHNYDSVGNLLKFYSDYKVKQQSRDISLKKFFHHYKPFISDHHHTCVGLGLELRRRVAQLNNIYPDLDECLYMVSAEEEVNDDYLKKLSKYKNWGGFTEKEHVLMALRFDIAGRRGILLADPGYHIARVIIVMEDKKYPHTDWFTQSEDEDDRKEYCYNFNKVNANFIEWTQRRTRGEKQNVCTSLIYIEKPYLTAVDVTERRNLVYDFRTLLARNMKGHIVAGLYFAVKPGQKNFTLFYETKDNVKDKFKMNFDDFLTNRTLSDESMERINMCSKQLHLPSKRHLLKQIKQIARLMNDVSFIDQLTTINKEIYYI